jgi:hypothetical protein
MSMKYSNIKKLAVVGLTMIGLVSQIGCKIAFGEEYNYCSFDEPVIHHSESNLYDLDEIKIRFYDQIEIISGEYIGSFSIHIGNSGLPSAKIPTRDNLSIDQKFTDVVLDSLDPSIHWKGFASLTPNQVDKNENYTEVKYDFQIYLTSDRGFIKIKGTVNAQIGVGHDD